MLCTNCGGWDETECPWNGDTGYVCTCIRCGNCGDTIGNTIDQDAHNNPLWQAILEAAEAMEVRPAHNQLSYALAAYRVWYPKEAKSLTGKIG